MRNEIRDGDYETGVDREIVCTPVFVFSFFFEHLIIVKINMMF